MAERKSGSTLRDDQLRAHRPQHRAGAVRPSDQADPVTRGPGLLQQPLPRCIDIGHPLAAGEHTALLDAALRTELARAVTVRQQHRMAGLQQLLRPVAIARLHRLRLSAQSAAAMQRDHGGKRAVTIGLVELGMQGQTARRDIDWRGAGNGAAPAVQAAARSVRNSVADNRRIGLCRIGITLRAR